MTFLKIKMSKGLFGAVKLKNYFKFPKGPFSGGFFTDKCEREKDAPYNVKVLLHLKGFLGPHKSRK